MLCCCGKHSFLAKKFRNFLLKIHTKKSIDTRGINIGNSWRKAFLTSLIGRPLIVKKNLDLLSKECVGMIGPKKYYKSIHIKKIPLEKDGRNFLLKKYDLIDNNVNFFAGTMFWCKFMTLYKMMQGKPLEESFFVPGSQYKDEKRNIYACERIFPLFFISNNQKILCI